MIIPVQCPAPADPEDKENIGWINSISIFEKTDCGIECLLNAAVCCLCKIMDLKKIFCPADEELAAFRTVRFEVVCCAVTDRRKIKSSAVQKELKDS